MQRLLSSCSTSVCWPLILQFKLICRFACIDPHNARRLVKLYPNDIPDNYLLKLELELDNYIDDMQRDETFQGLQNLVDLSVKLVETERHKVYDMVYLLLKLVLILPGGDGKC